MDRKYVVLIAAAVVILIVVIIAVYAYASSEDSEAPKTGGTTGGATGGSGGSTGQQAGSGGSTYKPPPQLPAPFFTAADEGKNLRCDASGGIVRVQNGVARLYPTMDIFLKYTGGNGADSINDPRICRPDMPMGPPMS